MAVVIEHSLVGTQLCNGLYLNSKNSSIWKTNSNSEIKSNKSGKKNNIDVILSCILKCKKILQKATNLKEKKKDVILHIKM